MTKQNNRLLSQDKSNHSTGALAATLFPVRRRNGTAVHQPKDVTEMEAARWAAMAPRKIPSADGTPGSRFDRKTREHLKVAPGCRPENTGSRRRQPPAQVRCPPARRLAHDGSSAAPRFRFLSRKLPFLYMMTLKDAASVYDPVNFFLHFKWHWLHLLCHI